MKIKSLDHLVLTTSDLEACLHFYVELLGMELDRSGNRYAVKFGTQKFNIHCRPGEFLPAARIPTSGSADICLIVAGNIAEIKAELESKGATIEEGIVPRTGACGPIDSLYLRDPDGNLVELSTYRQQEQEGSLTK
ncbi:MAG: VOC family protein [Oscillospiraceae bacterium]